MENKKFRFNIIDVVNSLVDKLKNVTRQSVVVISNFLLLSNKFSTNIGFDDKIKLNNVVKKDENVEYGLAFNFTSNDNVDDSDMVVEKKLSDDSNFKIKESYSLLNKDIIINNALALADKQMKISLQKKWDNISEYLTDSHYSFVAGKWADVSLEVVGGNYIIFTVLYESLIDAIYMNEKLSNDFINTVMGDKYSYVVITADEWKKLKDEYIANIKNGIKYEVKDFVVLDTKDEIQQKETTIVDRLFDIVGEENIEFK